MSIEELSGLGPIKKRSFIENRLICSGLDKLELLARCQFSINPVSGFLDLAVSGGADSVAMLVLGYLACENVRIWHLDHSLRPTSYEDASFVADLAKSFGVPSQIIKTEILAGSNLEERARDERRGKFVSGVATAHTADDLAETLLINLLRGSGVRGLGSIGASREHPILNLRRVDTEAICRAMEIEYVIDESNSDSRFQRNRMRNEVLPLLNDVSRRDVVPILLRTALLMQSVDRFISGCAEGIDPTDAKAISRLDPLIAGEVVRRWLVDERGHSISYDLVGEVLRVARGEIGAVDLPGKIRVRRSKGRLHKL